MSILVLNSGSSSLKYKLFNMNDKTVTASGIVERIGVEGNGNAVLKHSKKNGDGLRIESEIPDHKEALRMVLKVLQDPEKGVLSSLDEIKAVGHRVLHGKETFSDSVIVTDEIIEKLKSFIEIGPLHMPANIMGIEACIAIMPDVPQVAVFDTAFHQSMPSYAFLYALPYDLYEKYGLRRYGFHGTSHKYVAQRSVQLMGRPLDELNLITLHLGNGCSAAAIKGGKVVDTSMGLTPLEGLVMGTRCGDMDPAIVPFLEKNVGLSEAEIDELMNKKSGLLGITGMSSDMRDIQAARAEGNSRAEVAFNLFVYRIAKYVGSYMVAIGGKLDAIVFTAGIGENDQEVRSEVCKWLECLGARIDEDKNRSIKPGQAVEAVISAPDSKFKILVVPTNEELMIAMDTYRLITT